MGPWLDAVALQQLEEALLNISCDPSVQALVVFGSRAAGTARKDSDLDLLVISRILHLEPKAKIEIWWNHYRKLQGLTLEVDLIVSGVSDADQLAGSRWHVIAQAARTLLKLVDRHICALALNLNPNYPDEEWDCTAQLAGIDLPNCL